MVDLKKKYLILVNTYLGLWSRTLKLIMKVVPGWTVLWIILLVVQGFLPGTTVFLTKITIDSLVGISNGSTNLKSTIILLILTGITLLMAEVMQIVSDWVRINQADILTDYLKGQIHKKASEVDYEFYESSDYHDLLEQVRGNSISRPLGLLESFGTIFQSLITLLTFSTILIIYAWWLPVVLILGSLPALYLYLNAEQVMHDWVKATTPSRRLLSYLETMLTTNVAVAEMRAFELNGLFSKRYQELSFRLRVEKLLHTKKQLMGRFLAGILALFTAGIVIIWMAMRVLYKLATLGDLAAFYQVFSRGQAITQSLLWGINKLFSNTIYLENLFQFFDLKTKLKPAADTIPFPASIKEGIKFSNINFMYPGAKKKSLIDFNLFIPAGTIAAIVGVNGAGKSTLVKLLCRFYEADQGRIEIDGIDIRQFEVSELRKNLSVYFQFPLQFHETVANNIAYGDIHQTGESKDIETAAALGGADTFIKKLPDQYNTLLGRHFADGFDLSGGEWQRIALSRAYFRKAQILILDEPTSFMDPWYEDNWFKQLRQLTKRRTGFLITHRFTIAMRADIIHVVDEGQIIESGTHQSLLDQNGFYAESWKSQMQTENIGNSSPLQIDWV
jgi:ATP-binding cassette subfamily B protein